MRCGRFIDKKGICGALSTRCNEHDEGLCDDCVERLVANGVRRKIIEKLYPRVLWTMALAPFDGRPVHAVLERDTAWHNARLSVEITTSNAPTAQKIETLERFTFADDEWRTVYGWLKEWFEP